MLKIALVADPGEDVVGILTRLGELLGEFSVVILLPLSSSPALPQLEIFKEDEERGRFLEGMALGLVAGLKRRVEDRWGEVEIERGGEGTEWLFERCVEKDIDLLVVKPPNSPSTLIDLDPQEVLKHSHQHGLAVLFLP